MSNEFLGKVIKERREELRMSQEDLEKASNVSRGTISAIENGKSKDVLVGTLLSIAKALDTTIDNFFCSECPKN
jgi:transcriptional regulator with XRE-family HTH domain